MIINISLDSLLFSARAISSVHIHTCTQKRSFECFSTSVYLFRAAALPRIDRSRGVVIEL